MNYKEIEKLRSIMSYHRTLCKCGHSVLIPPELDKIICTWCGNYIFKDKKEEFKYRLKEEMLKNKEICEK